MVATHEAITYHFDPPFPTSDDVRQSNEALFALFFKTLSQTGTQAQFEYVKREYDDASSVGEGEGESSESNNRRNPVVALNRTSMRYYAGPSFPPSSSSDFK